MKVNIEISGVSPLLMHRFIDESGIKRDKNLTPREEAEKTAYIDEENKLYLPIRNIYACIIDAGRFHKDGKNKVTTMKSSLIPAGIQIEGLLAHFHEPCHWEVDSQPEVIPSTQGRIMRHRARLDKWCLDFTIIIDTKMFNPKMVRAIIDDAGSKCGLGDHRPNRKGMYGRFVVTKWEVLEN